MRILSPVPSTLLFALSAMLACQLGCAPKDDGQTATPAPAPTFAGWPAPTSGGYVPPPAPTGTATAPAPIPPPLPTSTVGRATSIDVGTASAAKVVLTGMAPSEAPGMSPDGEAFAGNFAEGSVLEHELTLMPGKCYTIIGAAIGIQTLDISLVFQPVPMFPPAPLANTTSTPGSTAVVGGRAVGCWKNPAPIGGQGKVIVRALRGSGLAAVQTFSK